jgi:hypothetical protein
LGTRRACVAGLCRLALQAKDPQRFALYCILSELQLASVPAPSPQQEEEEGMGSSYSSSTGRSLGIDDLVAPVLCYLDHVYAVAEAELNGETRELFELTENMQPLEHICTRFSLVFSPLHVPWFSVCGSGTELEEEFAAMVTTPGALEHLRSLLGQ